MPITIKDQTMSIPGEGQEKQLTGREIINIEDATGLDGLSLLQLLASDTPHPNPKYTKTKAIYAIAWVCLLRAGHILSYDDVLNNYSIDDFQITGEDPKKSETAES